MTNPWTTDPATLCQRLGGHAQTNQPWTALSLEHVLGTDQQTVLNNVQHIAPLLKTLVVDLFERTQDNPFWLKPLLWAYQQVYRIMVNNGAQEFIVIMKMPWQTSLLPCAIFDAIVDVSGPDETARILRAALLCNHKEDPWVMALSNMMFDWLSDPAAPNPLPKDDQHLLMRNLISCLRQVPLEPGGIDLRTRLQNSAAYQNNMAPLAPSFVMLEILKWPPKLSTAIVNTNLSKINQGHLVENAPILDMDETSWFAMLIYSMLDRLAGVHHLLKITPKCSDPERVLEETATREKILQILQTWNHSNDHDTTLFIDNAPVVGLSDIIVFLICQNMPSHTVDVYPIQADVIKDVLQLLNDTQKQTLFNAVAQELSSAPARPLTDNARNEWVTMLDHIVASVQDPHVQSSMLASAIFDDPWVHACTPKINVLKQRQLLQEHVKDEWLQAPCLHQPKM